LTGVRLRIAIARIGSYASFSDNEKMKTDDSNV